MVPANLPAAFNATNQDIEMLLAAQCHLGSKNMQVHMEQYLWKTRPDGINVINIGKTWLVIPYTLQLYLLSACLFQRIYCFPEHLHIHPKNPTNIFAQGESRSCRPYHCGYRQPSRYLRYLRPSLWPACRPQVRRSHWCRRYRRSLHPR